MANSAILSIEKSNPENEGWEVFEVGSYEEVIRISEENPNSQFLNHLAIISRIEIGESLKHNSPKGISVLSSILEAYISNQENRIQEASNQLEIYFKNKNALISYNFIQLGYTVFLKSGKDDMALGLLINYRKKLLDLAFLKEEAILCFKLKKYEELVAMYSTYPKEMNDNELLRLIGMALLFLGKNKEAESLLVKIPGRLNLPSFEEKKLGYRNIYKKISLMESKRSTLKPKELEDMGFAYLFHSEYAKAESVFIELVDQLEQ